MLKRLPRRQNSTGAVPAFVTDLEPTNDSSRSGTEVGISSISDREQRNTSSWIPTLDLLRFAAAFLVVFYHLVFLASQPTRNSVTDLIGYGWGVRALSVPAQIGGIGVQVFFVLSGFVIAQSAAGRSASVFARSRFLRLYPAVWICATLTLFVRLASGHSTGTATLYARAITIFPVGAYIDGAYWTLDIEIAFYALVFGAILVGKPSKFVELFISLGAISSLYWVTLAVLQAEGPPAYDRLSKLLLLQHGSFFAVGGLIWAYGQHRLTRGAMWAIPMTFLVSVWQIFHFTRSDGYSVAAAVISVLVWTACVALMIWSATRPGPVWLRRPWVRLLGLTTYPLYLTHQVVGAILLRRFQEMALSAGEALACTIFIVLGLAVTIAGWAEPELRHITAAVVDHLSMRAWQAARRSPN